MDYTLRRQPDGTVNAQPGDAVEVWDGAQWLTGYTYTDLMHGVCVMTKDGIRHDYYTSPNFVRHARGGAGWHRLREARLRAVVEAILHKEHRFFTIPFESEAFATGVNAAMGLLANIARAALADLDNTEPEA